jgi:hypothetical protein
VLSLPAVSVTGAQAAPGADPVDVQSRLWPDVGVAAPGEKFGVLVIADVASGKVEKLGLTLKLPEGVTYEGADAGCTPSTDGRSVTCAANDGQTDLLMKKVAVKVGADVAPNTVLTFTTTADIGDVVDVRPENNTATWQVKVRTAADLGIEWQAPSGKVTPGKDVKTTLVLTNHGPGVVDVESVKSWMGWDYWPKRYDESCWADPGVLVCDINRELAPGETVTLPFTWNFPKSAAGKTYSVHSSLLSSSRLDPNPANDKADLVFKFAKPSTSTPRPTPRPTSKPTPKPTSKPTAEPSASSSTGSGSGTTPQQGGGGQLASSGAGPVATAAAGAAVLAVAGGALVVRGRGRRRMRGSH